MGVSMSLFQGCRCLEMFSTLFNRIGDQCVSVSLAELLQLSGRAYRLSLSAYLVKNSRSDQQLSRLFGRGMEFSENRRYQAGDDSRAIDWKVTARTGKVHTKLFAEEKEREILLCADFRSPMFFATKGVFKSVQASLMIGTLAWSTAQAGNRLGGILFDNANHFEFRPIPGKRGIFPFLQKLAECAAFPSKEKTSDAVPSMDHAIGRIAKVAKPGSLVFLVSDFRCFSSSARDQLIQLSTHCDLCLCMMYDPVETSLPMKGFYPVSDGIRQLELNTYDRKALEKYQNQFYERRKQVASIRNGRHVRFIECSTSEDCFHVLKENIR